MFGEKAENRTPAAATLVFYANGVTTRSRGTLPIIFRYLLCCPHLLSTHTTMTLHTDRRTETARSPRVLPDILLRFIGVALLQLTTSSLKEAMEGGCSPPIILAGAQGIEPRSRGPKPRVVPLDHAPINELCSRASLLLSLTGLHLIPSLRSLTDMTFLATYTGLSRGNRTPRY